MKTEPAVWPLDEPLTACPQCGKPDSVEPWQTYCTRTCKERARKARQRAAQPCKVCGAPSTHIKRDSAGGPCCAAHSSTPATTTTPKETRS